jgi:hypothetical protein
MGVWFKNCPIILVRYQLLYIRFWRSNVFLANSFQNFAIHASRPE